MLLNQQYYLELTQNIQRIECCLKGKDDFPLKATLRFMVNAAVEKADRMFFKWLSTEGSDIATFDGFDLPNFLIIGTCSKCKNNRIGYYEDEAGSSDFLCLSCRGLSIPSSEEFLKTAV